jgi:uncharacterized membrane protein YphA (DoxX/SURF4 family)
MKGGIMSQVKINLWIINLVLLGLVMLVPGLLKLFVMKPEAITEMFTNLGFPVASLFAWALIVAEIGSGAAILMRWRIKHVAYIPVVILIGSAILVHFGNWPNFLVHIALASNFILLSRKF